MNTLTKRLLALGSISLAASASAQTILVNDTFTNAQRVGGGASAVTGLDRDGGTSNDWVVASSNTAIAGSAGGPLYVDAINVATGINGNSLRVANLGAFYDLKTYFSLTTLGAGETISVSFNIRTSLANPGNTNGGFRVGLFNSNGGQQTANISTYNSTSFDNDQGYVANYTTNATAGTTTANSIGDRSLGNNQGLFQGTIGNLTNVNAPVVGGAVAFDTTYAVTLSVTRSLDGLSNTISSSFAGASISATDSSSPYASFDTLGIFLGSNWGAASPNQRSNFIDDVIVTYSAIPEPSAFAALAGIAVLGLAATRRRRSS